MRIVLPMFQPASVPVVGVGLTIELAMMPCQTESANWVSTMAGPLLGSAPSLFVPTVLSGMGGVTFLQVLTVPVTAVPLMS